MSIFDDGNLVRSAVQLLGDSNFPLLAPDEIRTEKRRLAREVDSDTAFKLLARFEAELKLQVLRAARSRPRMRRDNLPLRYYRLVHQKRRSSVVTAIRELRFEDLLACLRDYLRDQGDTNHQKCSLIKGHYKTFRHWYAHGKPGHYPPSTPDAADVLTSITDILTSIGSA